MTYLDVDACRTKENLCSTILLNPRTKFINNINTIQLKSFKEWNNRFRASSQ